MSEAYLTNASFGCDSANARSNFHETALREARIASEYGQVEPATPVREGFLTRLRLAFAGPQATEACNCAA